MHFAEIDTGVFKGSKPKHDADFVFLQQHHVRYILELSFLPLLSRGERKKAHRFGMILITVHMNASPLAPSEKHVDEALCILRDTQFHPIYFHCEIGRDRTSLIAALYEMYFKQMPPERTWEAMKLYGFKDYWTLRGLKTYLEKHAARLRRAGTLHQHICACPGA